MKTTLRQIAMLQAIPLSDAEVIRWATTREIVNALRAAGHVCTARTVQRDLLACAEKFALDYRDGEGRVRSWSRHRSLEAHKEAA